MFEILDDQNDNTPELHAGLVVSILIFISLFLFVCFGYRLIYTMMLMHKKRRDEDAGNDNEAFRENAPTVTIAHNAPPPSYNQIFKTVTSSQATPSQEAPPSYETVPVMAYTGERPRLVSPLDVIPANFPQNFGQEHPSERPQRNNLDMTERRNEIENHAAACSARYAESVPVPTRMPTGVFGTSYPAMAPNSLPTFDAVSLRRDTILDEERR